MCQSNSFYEHVDKVTNLTNLPEIDAMIEGVDDVITNSWKRCMEDFQLDPSHSVPAHILPSNEIIEHKDQIDKFLHVARIGMEGLYKQVSSLNYVLLLTDATGITVDYISDGKFDRERKNAGLYLGADWTEERSGTNGVGTCLSTQQNVICHQTDHFHAKNIGLTCSAAPLFDPCGDLLAILDISALQSPSAKEGQLLANQMVNIYARIIESANFVIHFSNSWIIRFTNTPEFVDVATDNLLAVDGNGRILGATQSAASNLKHGAKVKDIVGKSAIEYFECSLDELMGITKNSKHRANKLLITREKHELFYAGMIEPKGVANQTSVSMYKDYNFKPLEGLSNKDPLMDKAINRAKRLIDKNVNIIIGGETGTGKEVMAKALHDSSQRASKSFIAVNCAAIPESLIESELFGHKAGAFTGASSKGNKGLIMQSCGGTLFLDEIGDMPLQLQSRLLRVLAEKEVMPVGSNKAEKIDLHVVSASHRDLRVLIAEGSFREDLYYRLNGAILSLPALRERTDRGFITMNLLSQEARERGISVKMTNEAMKIILAYEWPGNVRQLRNAIQFALAVCEDNIIKPEDLPDEIFESNEHMVQSIEGVLPTIPDATENSESAQYPFKIRKLLEALQQSQWNVTAVSDELGISRSTIYRRMERYGIVSPNMM
jgi:transcriptional regulator of acetoin/glycerol metabolism